MGTRNKIIITGGGTGGHVYPALAIAKGLVNSGIDRDKIIFIGSKNRIESELIPQEGFQLIELDGSGLNKNENLRNIIRCFQIFFSCCKILFLFIVGRPAMVIGVGGFASVPALFAATILNISRLVHEQNAYIGRTNRYAQKFGATLFTTFKNSANANESICIGLPLESNFEEERELRSKYISEPHRPKIVISGGSLGSIFINELVLSMIKKYYDDIEFSVIHITGKKNYDDVLNSYHSIDDRNIVEVFDYINDIAKVYATSDCVISRAGAGTCVELDIVNTPCVLIPLPSAPGDHQRLNAQILVDKGQAIILDQVKLTEDILYEAIVKQLSSSQLIATSSIHLDAREQIVNYILDKRSKRC